MGVEVTHSCRICRNADGNRLFEARELMFGTQERFEYVECAACGCLQIARIPEDLGRFYPESYCSFASRPVRRLQRVRTMLRNRRRRLQFGRWNLLGALAQAFLGPPRFYEDVQVEAFSPRMRILDVGCGVGRHLLDLADEGFTSLTGVDPFIAADIRYPNGVFIHKGQVSDLSGPFDFIIFHHSLEHMATPHRALADAARLMTENTLLVIKIPVVSPVIWQRYGIHWVQLDVPRHLTIHTSRSLELLLRPAGLEIVKTGYDSTALQFWGSEQYIKGIPLYAPSSYMVSPRQSMFSERQIAEYEAEAQRLNREGKGDQAIFYIRKSAG